MCVTSSNKQHVQVPNNMTIKTKLSTTDLLVYACLKGHKIKDNACFVSQDTIAKKLSMSRPTVKKSINNLIQAGYVFLKKEGRMSYYEFSKYDKFEPFSYEFLYRTDISNGAKGYIIGMQQSMYKDIDGLGKTTYTDKEAANIMNISEKTVQRYNRELKNSGFLSLLKTEARDEYNKPVLEKVFHLNELGQAIVFTLQKHDDQIKENTENINQLKETIASLQKQVEILLRDKKEVQPEIIL